MPEGCRHLTHGERCRIGALKESGLSDGAIAARLGRDRSSVWRELRRNAGGGGGYSPGEAQGRAEARRSAASSVPRRMTPDRWASVEGLPEEGWSPEQVAGRLRLEGGWTVGRQWTSGRVRADRKHPCLESSPDPAFFPFFPGSVSGCPGPFHSVPHRRRRPGTPETPAGETPAGPPVIRFRCRTDAVRPAVRRRPPSGPPTRAGRGEGRWRSRPACA